MMPLHFNCPELRSIPILKSSTPESPPSVSVWGSSVFFLRGVGNPHRCTPCTHCAAVFPEEVSPLPSILACRQPCFCPSHVPFQNIADCGMWGQWGHHVSSSDSLREPWLRCCVNLCSMLAFFLMLWFCRYAYYVALYLSHGIIGHEGSWCTYPSPYPGKQLWLSQFENIYF